MKTYPPVLIALVALAFTSPIVHAQTPTKIFVASFGNDANDGSRGAPKRNFQAAHDAVAASGQIVALDTAGYGTLIIGKSVAVTVPPGVIAFVTAAGGSDGITINAGTSDRVALRGLIVESATAATGNGIKANTVGDLALDDCTVRNFANAAIVNTAGTIKLYAHNCTLRGNSAGLTLQASAGSGIIIAVATNCLIDQNSSNGVLATATPGGNTDLTLAECTISGNGGALVTQGGGTTVRVDNCRVTGNSIGAFASAGAQILSRSNNTLEKNTSNNAFPGNYIAQ
jgi:hypothetical protein